MAAPGLAGERIKALLADRGGTLWVAARQGVGPLVAGQWTPSAFQNTPGHEARTLMQDRAGRIWLGTYDGSLRVLDQGQFVPFARAPTQQLGSVSCLLEDREGTLWVGTGRGLYRLGREGLEAVTPPESQATLPVVALFEDEEGSIWVGTDGGGLLQLRSARMLVYTTRQGLPKNNVLSLHQDSAGAMWIGTYGGGIARFAEREVAGTWSMKDGLGSDEINALYSDRTGTLWVGHMRGLDRIEQGGPVRRSRRSWRRSPSCPCWSTALAGSGSGR